MAIFCSVIPFPGLIYIASSLVRARHCRLLSPDRFFVTCNVPMTLSSSAVHKVAVIILNPKVALNIHSLWHKIINFFVFYKWVYSEDSDYLGS